MRYRFIDHYRGWAVIAMIETHSVNAWLADPYRNSAWFLNLRFLNGFVAPSFLFLAGISFLIVARKRDFAFFNPDFLKQLRRFTWIWILGYILHFPVVHFHQGHLSLTHLEEFYKVDVLHTIAVGLIILLFLTAAIKNLSRVILITLALTVATIAASPIAWTHDFELHPFFANYLNGKQTVLFPLFPWVAFLFSGAIVGYYFFNRPNSISRIAIVGSALLLIGFLTKSFQFSYYNFWIDSPQWMMMRIGIVMLLFSFFYALEQFGVPGSPVVHLLGTQSLVAYVVHLEVLFGTTGSKAWFPFLNDRQFTPTQTFALFCGLLSITTLLTWMWKKISASFR